MRWVAKAKLRAFYPWENSPLPILEEGWWLGLRASMTGMENIGLLPTPKFKRRTENSAASCYRDYVIQAAPLLKCTQK